MAEPLSVTDAGASIVDQLNQYDRLNQDLLDKVVMAANEAAMGDCDVCVNGDVRTVDTDRTDSHGNTIEVAGREAGSIQWGGKEASIQGTGGVALLEYAKDAIQTAVSNISGIGTNQIQMRKLVERKVGGMQ
jgi:hypothetical protein